MTEAERIDTFEQQLRSNRRFPQTLIEAFVHYLKGQGALELARQEWQAATQSKRYLYLPILRPSESEEPLDALDLRALDLYSVTEMSLPFLNAFIQQKRLNEAFEYLLKRGTAQRQALDWALTISGNAVLQGQITALGHYLLAFVPDRASELLEILASKQGYARNRLYPAFVHLLVTAQPPYTDLAWQIAQEIQQQDKQAPHAGYGPNALGSIARILLKADPARFTDWVRAIAGPDSPGNISSRNLALQALMEHDPARHIDLALEAARKPLPSQQKYASAQIQITGLQAALDFEAVSYWPLLEEAAFSPNYFLSARAITFLAAANFDQARPTLQRCVASSNAVSAARALKVLLKQSWDGQAGYTLSLLAHRSKGVRDQSRTWLVAQGQAVVDGLGPYLTHRRADARLAAALTLAQIGGPQASALLEARLDAEKTPSVTEAIVDAVGVPAARAAFQGADAHSAAAITAEAEAMPRYAPKPTLAWFDAQEAPALRWTDGTPVPPTVLSYLLYHQSRVQNKDVLSAQVSQALRLIDRSASGDLALALYRGWITNGAASAEAWLLPLAGALGDDRLASHLRRQIDDWAPGPRRTLAAQAIKALALIESESTLDELKALAKEFTRGMLKATIHKAIATATAR